MLQTDLPGIVVGIRDVHGEAVVLAEVGSKEISSAVYANATSETGRTGSDEGFGRSRYPHR